MISQTAHPQGQIVAKLYELLRSTEAGGHAGLCAGQGVLTPSREAPGESPEAVLTHSPTPGIPQAE